MSYYWNGPFWALDHCRRSGGVVIPLSPSLQSLVVSLGSDMEESCVCIALLVQERVIGLCVVYAPNRNSDRSWLWDWMVYSLPTT